MESDNPNFLLGTLFLEVFEIETVCFGIGSNRFKSVPPWGFETMKHKLGIKPQELVQDVSKRPEMFSIEKVGSENWIFAFFWNSGDDFFEQCACVRIDLYQYFIEIQLFH